MVFATRTQIGIPHSPAVHLKKIKLSQKCKCFFQKGPKDGILEQTLPSNPRLNDIIVSCSLAHRVGKQDIRISRPLQIVLLVLPSHFDLNGSESKYMYAASQQVYSII